MAETRKGRRSSAALLLTTSTYEDLRACACVIEEETPRERGTEDLLTSKSLELGAGGGLTGLAVARGCDLGGTDHALPLVITDQKEMYPLMRHNIALNGLEGRVEAEILNWWVLSLLIYVLSR